MGNPRFGQLVIGPPGSGKTTYCSAMYEFLTKIGRSVLVVNLDPANDYNRPEPCHICLSELVESSEAVSLSNNIGPNAAILECFDRLAFETGTEWLVRRIQEFDDSHYLLIDCPGQVELYTYHPAIKKVIKALTDADVRLCSVNLADSMHCSQPNIFVSLVLVSLNFMLHLELPAVNVFTKLDLLKNNAPGLSSEFYTEVLDLKRLIDADTECNERDKWLGPYKKLNGLICDLIHDYSLVCFSAVNIKDRSSMAKLLAEIDRAVGYVMYKKSKLSSSTNELISCACRPELYRRYVNDLFEKYRTIDEDD